MDIALKQRLVGASVLIALAVVVLPMLLGGRPDDSGQETQKIELAPQPPELGFETRRYPIGDTPVESGRGAEEAPQATPADSAPQPSERPVAGAVAHVELEPEVQADVLQEAPVTSDANPTEADAGDAPEERSAPANSEAAITADKPQAPAAVTGADSGRYVVQVASFGSQANAGRLAETLRGQGYSVLSDTVSSDVGVLHRVRVGPYPSEALANAAVTQLRRQFSDIKPRVVDLQPDAAAQVTAPSDPLVRWVVQIGSFSSADNADKLVERLRAEGLSAYKEEIASSASRLYRVRVGPFLEREEAIRVDGVIADRLSLDGVVMSAD